MPAFGEYSRQTPGTFVNPFQGIFLNLTCNIIKMHIMHCAVLGKNQHIGTSSHEEVSPQ